MVDIKEVYYHEFTSDKLSGQIEITIYESNNIQEFFQYIDSIVENTPLDGVGVAYSMSMDSNNVVNFVNDMGFAYGVDNNTWNILNNIKAGMFYTSILRPQEVVRKAGTVRSDFLILSREHTSEKSKLIEFALY